MDAYEMARLVTECFVGHARYPTKPSKAVRKWDGKTPYGIHPGLCFMAVMAETALPDELRARLAQALLFHDFKEDTTAKLPERLLSGVEELINGMTFDSSDAEMEQVWTRGSEVLLGKVYDKTSNLLDGVWMKPEKREKYCAYLLRLCDEVEKVYGQLNILKMARAIAV